MQKFITIILFFLVFSVSFAQEENENKETKPNDELIVKNKPKQSNDFVMNPLAPARAAFYSAILPGLGQAYNKKYWLIPLIYGGMSTSMYYYTVNNNRYNDFLEAYKLDLAGKPHNFGNLDRNALERGLKGYKSNRDLSMFITIGIYVLNVVEANVDAHLPNRKIDTNLSFRPSFTVDPISYKMNYGATVTFDF